MGESIGLLKKRIREILPSNTVGQHNAKLNILKILDEAKQDYPVVTDFKLPPPSKGATLNEKVERVQLELFHRRVKWFEKWFGERKNE